MVRTRLNVYTRDKVVEKLKYMHRNPVKGGLFEKPGEWLWSSTRDICWR